MSRVLERNWMSTPVLIYGDKAISMTDCIRDKRIYWNLVSECIKNPGGYPCRIFWI